MTHDRAVEMLTHAIYPCKWGSGTADRVADAGDLEAAELLRLLLTEIRLNK